MLSSGGARGLAHIGVIERLEEEGYEISSIAGTSIGALVGAFYACGKLEAYKKWAIELDRMDVFKLFDFTFSVQGFIRGEKVFTELKKVIEDIDIEDMPIPFAAIASDAKNKKEVVFDSGSMYQAIRASTAIPTVLKPLKVNDMELVDGGVTNPVPVDRVKRHSGDILVVSNVNASIAYEKPKKTEKVDKQGEESYEQKISKFFDNWGKLLPGTSEPTKKLGFFDLINRSIDLMQDKLTDALLEKHNPDMLIQLSRDAASTFEFFRAKELIEAGRKAYDEVGKNG